MEKRSYRGSARLRGKESEQVDNKEMKKNKKEKVREKLESEKRKEIEGREQNSGSLYIYVKTKIKKNNENETREKVKESCDGNDDKKSFKEANTEDLNEGSDINESVFYLSMKRQGKESKIIKFWKN